MYSHIINIIVLTMCEFSVIDFLKANFGHSVMGLRCCALATFATSIWVIEQPRTRV